MIDGFRSCRTLPAREEEPRGAEEAVVYEARQVVLRDPEGNVFRISSNQDDLRQHSWAGLE